ncbi:polysaccharide biosynthesis tyrosine autokinase [Actinomycetospora chibensis]|uniref:non-specific protein-tyrosine kinase n=1 Tax=Actinomycetospora chibensis TaxID=663606 RepID=A0ABV9RM36_9PSEU|nr:polysaccharide biosynthesis tyrosine autokinase [Actinomycetospora chibensis]MDD7927205.1 polysaccharide biosynthesis tyrosine autokinase [Actinomycetospora chibensis]
MSVNDVVVVVRRRWKEIGVVFGICLLIGFAYTFSMTPIYLSQTTIYITSQADNTTQAYQGGLLSEQRVQSYSQLLAGERVGQGVVERLGLPENASQIAAKMSASTQPDSVILVLSVRDSDPARSAAIANAGAASFSDLVAELEQPIGRPGPPQVIARVVQPAVPAAAPIEPRPALYLGLAAVLGLILGLGVGFLRDLLDTSVRSTDTVTNLTMAPIIGVMPKDSSIQDDALTVRRGTQSTHAEAARQIRTNLQFLSVDNPARRVLVTSSVPAEGKTTSVCNLALAISASGYSVCLVEADLRRPKAGSYLGLTSDVGLTTILAGRAELKDVLQSAGDRLTFLGSGAVPPNPSELLSSERMQNVLDELGAQFDYVLVDAPPLLPVSDAAALAPACDGVILFCRHGLLKAQQLRASVAILANVRARLLGAVLTFVPKADARVYGQYDSYYSDPSASSAGAPRPTARSQDTQSAARRPSPHRRAEVSDGADAPTVESRLGS